MADKYLSAAGKRRRLYINTIKAFDELMANICRQKTSSDYSCSPTPIYTTKFRFGCMVSEKNLFFSKKFFKSRKNHVFCTLNFYYTIYFRANSIRNCFLYVTKYRNGDFFLIKIKIRRSGFSLFYDQYCRPRLIPTDSKKMAARIRTRESMSSIEFTPCADLEPIKMQRADAPTQKNISTRRVPRMPVTVRM